MVEELSLAKTFEGYDVHYEAPRNFIPLTPTMVGCTEIHSVDPADLLAEIWSFVTDYNRINDTAETLYDDDAVWYERVFAVSCSSFALADYICDQDADRSGAIRIRLQSQREQPRAAMEEGRVR